MENNLQLLLLKTFERLYRVSQIRSVSMGISKMVRDIETVKLWQSCALRQQ